MPAAVVAVAASVAGAVAPAALGFAAGTIAGAVVGALAAAAVSFIGSALMPKPSQPALPDFGSLARDRTQMVRQPITTRRIIYGEVKVSGPITYLHVSSNKRVLHLLITLAGHPVESIGDVWFGDDRLEIAKAPQWAAGEYATGDVVYWDGSYYERTSTAYPTMLKPTGDIDPAYEAVTVVSDAPDTAPSLWSETTAPAVGTTYVAGRYAGKAKIWTGDGTDDGDADLLAALRAASSEWTVDHKQQGCAKILVQLTWDRDVYASGIPQVSALVRGKNDIYDPRTGTLGYTDNWALCVADYLTYAQGVGAASTEVDWDAVTTAADTCEEAVPLAGGGTEDRYTVNGTLDTEHPPKTNLRGLLAAGAGKAIWSGGVWRVLAGEYQAPTVTLGLDDFDGPIRVTTRRSRRDLFNAVRATYTSPEQAWQPTDLPVLVSDTFVAEDGGETIYEDYEFPFTTSAARGQRMMKIALLQNRQQVNAEIQCKLTALRCRAGDVIRLDVPRMGWGGKEFVVQEWRFALRDNGALGIDMTVQETDASVFDWTTSEEQTVDTAPDTNLPNAWDVTPPDGLDVAESLYVTRDGAGVKAKATLTAGVPDDASVAEYEFAYKLVTATDWTTLPRQVSEVAEVLDVTPGVYDWRVKSRNRIGISSEWVTVRKEVLGKTALPVAPTGLTVSTIGGLAVLRWTRTTELDVLIGGTVQFRWSPASTSWGASVSIGEAVPGGDTVAVLPLKAGVYHAAFVDSDGNVGGSATVTTDGASILEYAALSEIVESPTYAGVNSNTASDGGVLRLTGTGQWDDIADLDSVSSVDLYGGAAPTGTYDFAGGLDLGSVQRVRLTALIDALIRNAVDLVDDRTTNVDAWDDWDGTAGAPADAAVWVRTTQDDPSASPTWSDWQRLDSTEANIRAAQFQCRLSTGDPAYQIEISDLRVKVDNLAA